MTTGSAENDGGDSGQHLSDPASAEPDGTGADATPTAAPRGPGTPPAWMSPWMLVGPLIVLWVTSLLADAFWAAFVEDHPLLLITMNARNRNLALVATEIDPIPYYVVGTVRLLVSDPLFFLLGYFYGDRAVEWIEHRWGDASTMVKQVEEWFSKAAGVLVFVAPNNLICTLAGSSGMRPALFLVLNVTGTIARLIVIRLLGDVFSVPLDWFRELVGDYTPIFIAVSVAVVAVVLIRESRRGTSEVQDLVELAAEIEDETSSGAPGTVDDGR